MCKNENKDIEWLNMSETEEKRLNGGNKSIDYLGNLNIVII